MRPTQEILKENGIEPRQIIFDVILKIINDSKWKLSHEDVTQKIITWHESLINFDDKRILSGLEFYRNSEYDSIPSIGVFKKGCRRKEYEPSPTEEKQPWELRQSNIAKIKAKLMRVND